MSLLRRIWRPPARMVLVALLLRLALIVLAGTYHLDPSGDHWRFGWEMGRVARSITLGRGFSSPYQSQTGPTAHFAPAYPYLLAGVFKLFGIYTDTSAFVILTLNSLCSALTCLTIFHIGVVGFGRRVANLAAWIWAFHPMAVYVSVKRVWDTPLSALLLSLILVAALHLDETKRPWNWACFGLLCGVTALNNPAIVSVLPFVAIWLGYRLRGKSARPARMLGIAALVFAFCLMPWTLRNYREYHRFIPLRSNFWLEVYVGNNAEATGTPVLNRHPSHNEDELAQYGRLGETAYFAEKKRQAIEYIVSHPSRFAWLTLVRIAAWWTGGWEIAPGDWFVPWSLWLELLGFTAQSSLGLIGLALAFRNRRPAASLFAIFVLVYPLAYYFIFAGRRYSHPFDPVVLVLASFTLQQVFYREQTAPPPPVQGRPITV